MDVRYNNIFESTRQYFQGVPVNDGSNKPGVEEKATIQKDERASGLKHGDFLNVAAPSTSRNYWMPQNQKDETKSSETPYRHLAPSAVSETETRHQHHSNLLPPITALSPGAASNYSPFKGVNKMNHWGQFHPNPKSSSASTDFAPPSSVAVSAPYYPLSSQVAVTSSPAFYYPANVQAPTSKNTHYYHPPNDMPVNRSRSGLLPNSRESAMFSSKTNSNPFTIDSKHDLKPSFQASSARIPSFLPNPGFKLPVTSFKPSLPYQNESLQLGSKIMHTSTPKGNPSTSISVSSYSSNQNMFSMSPASSQANCASFQPDINKRVSLSQRSSSSATSLMKPNAKGAPSAPSSHSASTSSSSSASVFGYSVPKIQPTGLHQSMIQLNPKRNVDMSRENTSRGSLPSVPSSMPHILHGASKKLPNFPETALYPVKNEKKSSSISVHYPSASPSLSERSMVPQHLQTNKVVNQESDLWASKTSVRLKRESPLDLSVKTVRQSADSTAKDEQENNNSYSLPGFQTLDCRIRPQISEPYTPVSVPGFGYPRNSGQSPVSVPSAPGRAPPSDLPRGNVNSLFSIPPQRLGGPQVIHDQEKNKAWRTNGSDPGYLQHRANSRSNSEFHGGAQRSQPSEPVAKPAQQRYYEQRHLSGAERSPQPRSIISQNYSIPQSLYSQANLVENTVSNLSGASIYPYSRPVQSNSSEPFLSKKRAIPVESGYVSQAKSPKVDAWLKTIDQQIEEKFSSYVTSRANDRSGSTPRAPTSASDASIQPKVDGSRESFSKGYGNIRYLPYGDERVTHETKVAEGSAVSFQQNVNLAGMRELHPSQMSGDRVNQCSLVQNQESVRVDLFKNREVALGKAATNSGAGVEKFDPMPRSKPPTPDTKLNFKGKEDEEKVMPRPRTKAELKQVESSDFSKSEFCSSNDNPATSSSKMNIVYGSTTPSKGDVESNEIKSEDGLPTPSSENSVSPPKLTEEEISRLPRKKLCSELDESEDGQNPLDPCVFDFRDSDSECEMPVLERQTLDEMRKERDRRVHSKIVASNENLASEQLDDGEPSSPSGESKDPFWMEPFDSFLEQLTTTPVEKMKKGSRKRSKQDSASATATAPSDSVASIKSPDESKKTSSISDYSVTNKIKEEILLRDNCGMPKVLVKDFKKEEKRRFSNLKLEKLSTIELKQEIAELTNKKKELQEKILESSSVVEKPEPLDELKPNCLHLKKLKLRQKSVKSKDIGNEENIKRSVNLKIRKQRHLKRLGSIDTEQTSSSRAEPKDPLSPPSRSLDSSSSKFEASSSRKRKQIESSPNSLSSRFMHKDPKSCPELVLKKVKRKDSSESVLSSESDDSKRKKKLHRREDEPVAKHLIDDRTKRKILKRRRASTSTGGRPGLRSATGLRSSKSMLNVKRQKQLKSKKRKLTAKTVKQTVKPQVDENGKEATNIVTEAVHLTKKKFKFKSVRRKFRSSGFDYLRKKKKQMKKPADSDEVKIKKLPTIRAKPENIDELQVEIKGWVINKGLGESILHRAARLGYPDAVAYCLEVLEIGASIRDNAGYTPLHEASHRGHLAIARMLLMYGADSSASAIGGIRPLHEASENGHLELVRLLLSYGADPLLATYSGQTPISLAHDVAMKNLLEHHLADVQGTQAPKWDLDSLPIYFDETMCGCAVLSDPPEVAPRSDPEVEIEYSENNLPSTFWLIGEPMSDVWAMWHEVASVLRLKSTDALLKLLGKTSAEILRELTPSEFTSKASNPSIFGASNFKFLNKCQKIVLVKYTEQLRSFMNIEKLTISLR